MRINLRPTDNSFYDLFSRAAANLVRGTELLTELSVPGVDVQSVSERLVEVEHDSDAITHELFNKINTSFITPFDREDIYRLGSNLDDVMDMMDEVVDLILLYEVRQLPAELSTQVEVLQRCAELTAAAMPQLQQNKALDEYWIEINRLENAGDKNHRRTLARLFSGEFKTIEVLKLKDIVESLEEAIDAFEKVANIVEQIAVKES